MDKEKLKELRVKLDLTQEEMAERLGITAGAVSKIETGAHGLRGSTRKLAEQMAERLGITAGA